MPRPPTSITRMWDVVPRILLRSSSSKPDMTASTTMSAMTPMAMPAIAISVKSDRKPRPPFERRYRSPIRSSKGMPLATASVLVRPEGLGPQQGEQDHVADRLAVGEEHHHPVDAHALARRRREPVLERSEVVLVEAL